MKEKILPSAAGVVYAKPMEPWDFDPRALLGKGGLVVARGD